MEVLKHTLLLPIRFSETDAMGVVWHGNYLKFFEDAREQFGRDFNIHYLDMFKAGMLTPIVHSEIFHKASLYYGDVVRIESKLIKLAAAKIKFEFIIYNDSSNQIAAKGSTTQVFMDAQSRELQLTKPDFYSEWEKNQNWIEIE